MRRILTSLVLFGVLAAGSAHANRWDQRQPLFADRERRPLLQRHPKTEPTPAQPAREESHPASTQPAPESSPGAPAATPAVAPQQHLQPADAAQRAQQQYGGRVLSVAPGDSGYHVRLLRNGEVSVVTVPNQ
jgi:hypothetical protein